MHTRIHWIPAALALAVMAGTAAAQSAQDVQRNVNQQQRIEQGLQSGALTTREAGRLEREEARVSRDQARALGDGAISPAEQRRLTAEQNRVSRDIDRQKHDAQTGNPASASSRRMQADVQRNINQQQRIEAGVQSGALTNRETARLERGQAQVERGEARAAADGHVGAGEQTRIQARENRQSRKLFREKHDRQQRG